MTKLTLMLDDSIIKRAKTYARQHSSSVSKLVEEYFRYLTEKESAESLPITGKIKKLSGIVKTKKEINPRAERAAHLSQKHSV